MPVKTVDVLIAIGLDDIYMQRISDVDNHARVHNIAGMVNAELRCKAETAAAIQESRQLDSLLSGAEIMLMYMPPPDLIARAPNIKWIQFIGAGIDLLARNNILGSSATITNASGVQSIPIAEHVLCLMLMLAKRVPRFVINQQGSKWEPIVTSELNGKTLGIIGLGNIGREVARLAGAFGMRVLATRRSIVRRGFGIMGVDSVYPVRELHEMLSECDFVVLSPPLTKETTGMIGERELRAMKPSSFIVNISRGGVIDQQMLVRALKEDWIAGAALDVFDSEPLPPESELWQLPNVIVSPHIAGLSSKYLERMIDLFCQNLKRYLDGQPLLNVVDKARGY